VKPPSTINTHLKKKGQEEAKIGLFQGQVLVEGGAHKERVNEGEYDECILYPYVKTE
jgi:hypothetical protein